MSTPHGYVWRAWDPADDDEHGMNAWTAVVRPGGIYSLFGVACCANPTATYHDSQAEALTAVCQRLKVEAYAAEVERIVRRAEGKP